MEHIILPRESRKPHPFEIERYRLQQSNKRADRINAALGFAIRCLAFSAAIGFIMKFING